MSCPRLEQSVFLHAHGQLGGAKRWLVESHLQQCTVCRAQWAQWTVERDQLRRAFAPLSVDPVDMSGLSAAVGARIRTERALPDEAARPAQRPPWARHTVAISLAVALLAIGISALAAFWQPVMDHCRPPGQSVPVPGASNVPDSCPLMHNSPSNVPGAAPGVK